MTMLKSKNEMISERNNLLVEKMKLDRFFTKYLDKFSSKMKSENTKTPIWNLYNNKMKEYEDLDIRIKSLTYYINKERNV